jgi:hypothetical protein
MSASLTIPAAAPDSGPPDPVVCVVPIAVISQRLRRVDEGLS